MNSYGSTSFRKYATRAVFSLLCTVLTVAFCSTTATGQMFFSGDEDVKQRVRQVWDTCSRRSSPHFNPSVTDPSRAFVECLDTYLQPTRGVYYGVSVRYGRTAGYAWNYQTLTGAFERARAECHKNRPERPCQLRAFVANGCIAHGYHNESRHNGDGVGPTKEVAERRMQGEGRDARSCGPGCEVRQVFCAG